MTETRDEKLSLKAVIVKVLSRRSRQFVWLKYTYSTPIICSKMKFWKNLNLHQNYKICWTTLPSDITKMWISRITVLDNSVSSTMFWCFRQSRHDNNWSTIQQISMHEEIKQVTSQIYIRERTAFTQPTGVFPLS